ncbi:MAG: cell wall-binding repeat-containing protein [Clostridioides sp.]|nr:cell wall-binding repeat-containing protein [Clostridioides sp.]
MRRERIQGETRYATSFNIANKLKDLTTVSEISIVNGDKGLADAVSIAPISAQNTMPVILTNKNGSILEFESYIADNSIKKEYVIG